MSDRNDHYWPLGYLVLCRLREFWREPEAIFWVYGFPMLMVIALGVAFRNRPIEQITVDVEAGPHANDIARVLSEDQRFVVRVNDGATSKARLRTGKTELVVVASSGTYDYVFDPTRSESLLARNVVDDALQDAAGRQPARPTRDVEFTEPGGRYIDFLIPGLLGMNLMGGGMWGVGFVIVDMRLRKLLKRLLATPMRKRDFLLGVMISRLMFMVPEVLFLLVFARLAFGVVNHGSVTAVLTLVLLGAFTFAGLGLLIASRAKTLEAVSGLMNLCMLPMWILSGIFFSSERFPEVVLPVIRLLPLTPLIDALRAVMLDGASLASLWPQLCVLSAWGGGSFIVALRIFRWR